MRGFSLGRHGAIRLAAVAGLVAALAGCAKKDAGVPDQMPPTWSISGTVAGDVSAGVTVRIQGGNRSAVTKADGTYTISGLYDRTYTLEVSLPGYAFTPPTRSVTVHGANVTGQDFTGRVGVAIAGSVSGDATAGVTLTLTGPAPATSTTTVTTDSTGAYAFHDVVAGVYSVAPSLAGGWTFAPANSLVTVAGASVTGPNFTSIAPTHAISGRVTGAVSAGVTVVLSGGADAVAVTDATGNYSFTGLTAGSYSVSPSRAGYAFAPAVLDVPLAASDATGKDFVAAAVYRVAGWVTGDVLGGVSVRVTSAAGASTTATTDAAGHFEVSGLAAGNYDVTPSLDGYTFSPATRSVSVAGADVTNANYASKVVPTYSVTGAVPGLAGVTMALEGATSVTTTTDAAGTFALSGVPSGSYMLIPTLQDYVFDPASRVVAVSGANVAGQTFTATVSPSARTISGIVSGDAAAGVTVALAGVSPVTPTVTVATDATGHFAFRGLADGLYLVTPSLAGGYAFTPANCLVTVSGPSVTSVAFTGAAVPHAISGKVSGAVAAGVTVALSGDATATVATALDGSYAFPGLSNGSYAVTPSLAGYVFGPASASVTLQGADAPGVNFVAAATHRIAGTVSGAIAAGVKVTLSGAGAGDITTDATGYFEFPDLVDGTYFVTPSLDSYTFSPDSLGVVLAGADMTTADFIALLVPTYSVSGTVAGAVIGGVTVTISGGAAATTTTDATGAYSFHGLYDGSYMLVPSIAGHAFAPAARAFAISGADATGQDFATQP
jgi:Carboxypeptidase regulatory-like domain